MTHEKQNNFKNLLVWQKSRKLACGIYKICERLPTTENFGLSSQIKRSAVSVPSNIAEGYRRWNTREFIQFLGVASGSAAEMETQLILVSDIYGINTDQTQLEAIEVQKMLSAFVASLRARDKQRRIGKNL